MDQLAGDTGISAVEEKKAQYKGGQATKTKVQNWQSMEGRSNIRQAKKWQQTKPKGNTTLIDQSRRTWKQYCMAWQQEEAWGCLLKVLVPCQAGFSGSWMWWGKFWSTNQRMISLWPSGWWVVERIYILQLQFKILTLGCISIILYFLQIQFLPVWSHCWKQIDIRLLPH